MQSHVQKTLPHFSWSAVYSQLFRNSMLHLLVGSLPGLLFLASFPSLLVNCKPSLMVQTPSASISETSTQPDVSGSIPSVSETLRLLPPCYKPLTTFRLRPELTSHLSCATALQVALCPTTRHSRPRCDACLHSTLPLHCLRTMLPLPYALEALLLSIHSSRCAQITCSARPCFCFNLIFVKLIQINLVKYT